MKKLKAIAITVLMFLVSCTSAFAMQDTILAPATKTATYTSPDKNKTGYSTVVVLMNVTAVPGVTTLTLTIQGKDAHGNYYTLCSSIASATTGYVVLTAGTGAFNVINSTCNVVLPDTWNVVVTHSTTGSFTYGIDYNTQ